MDQPSVPSSPRKSGAAARSPMTTPNGRKASSVSGSTVMRVTVAAGIAPPSSGAPVRMGDHPVPRDVHLPAYPHAIVLTPSALDVNEGTEAPRALGGPKRGPEVGGREREPVRLEHSRHGALLVGIGIRNF